MKLWSNELAVTYLCICPRFLVALHLVVFPNWFTWSHWLLPSSFLPFRSCDFCLAPSVLCSHLLHLSLPSLLFHLPFSTAFWVPLLPQRYIRCLLVSPRIWLRAASSLCTDSVIWSQLLWLFSTEPLCSLTCKMERNRAIPLWETRDFFAPLSNEQLDKKVHDQFEEHPRLVKAAKELMDYGDWGYNIILQGGGWDLDWDNISEVPRAAIWHPPQLPPTEQIRNAHIRTLATAARHPFPNIFRDPLARLQFIGQQMDEGVEGYGGLTGPCSWCGTFTGLWCDGVAPTASCFGWNCRASICSWCRSVFSECRRCSVHTGIPLQMDPRAIVQVCRVEPNICTKRLLEFKDVRYSETAVGIWHIKRAIEGTIHLRLTCFTSYGGFYFPHIDKRYNVVSDFSSPEDSLFDDDEGRGSSEAATTPSVIEQEVSGDELMEVNPQDFPDANHSPELLE